MKLSWKKFNELAKEYHWTPIYKGGAISFPSGKVEEHWVIKEKPQIETFRLKPKGGKK